MIQFGNDHRLTVDSQAAQAVRSLRASDASTKVEILENDYYRWLGVTVQSETGAITATRWDTKFRYALLRLVGAPINIFRRQVLTLAQAYNTALNNAAAADIQKEFAKDYQRMFDANKQFRSFPFQHFPKELASAEARNLALLTLAREMLAETIAKR